MADWIEVGAAAVAALGAGGVLAAVAWPGLSLRATAAAAFLSGLVGAAAVALAAGWWPG